MFKYKAYLAVGGLFAIGLVFAATAGKSLVRRFEASVRENVITEINKAFEEKEQKIKDAQSLVNQEYKNQLRRYAKRISTLKNVKPVTCDIPDGHYSYGVLNKASQNPYAKTVQELLPGVTSE